MANKTVSLTVHRNNRDQRERKRVRTMFRDDVKKISAIPDIAGYAVVAWDKDRGYQANWYTPKDGPMPGAAMPDFIRFSLQKEITKADMRRTLWPSDDEAI